MSKHRRLSPFVLTRLDFDVNLPEDDEEIQITVTGSCCGLGPPPILESDPTPQPTTPAAPEPTTPAACDPRTPESGAGGDKKELLEKGANPSKFLITFPNSTISKFKTNNDFLI